MTDTTISDSAVKLDKARRLYETAQANAAAEQEQIALAAAQQQIRADKELLAVYDDDVLAEQVRQARRDLHAAALADPVWRALAGVYAAQLHRAHAASDALNAAARLGIAQHITPRAATEPDADFVPRLLATLGEDIYTEQHGGA